MRGRGKEMFCSKCGNAIEDGNKFCNKCGAPVETSYVSAQQYTSVLNRNSITENKSTWLGTMVVLAILTIISLVCAGITETIGVSGVMQVKLSVSFLPVAGILNSIKPYIIGELGSGYSAYQAMKSFNTATVAYGIYTVIVSVLIIAYVLSIIFIVKKKFFGVIIGIAASAITLFFSILFMIAIFMVSEQIKDAFGYYASTAVSAIPSFWMWFAVPISILNGLFLIVKGRELTS